MKLAVLLEVFDGRDLFVTTVASRGDARAGRLAVNQNGAGAATPLAAAVLAAREIEVIAKHTQQAPPFLGLKPTLAAVDVQLGKNGHLWKPSMEKAATIVMNPAVHR